MAWIGVFVGWVALFAGAAVLFRGNLVDVTLAGSRLLHLTLFTLLLLNTGFGFFLLWRAEKRADNPLRFLRIVVAAGCCFGLFLASEALARAFPVHDSFAVNPGARFLWADYFLPPNSLGFKDREPGPKRGPRILVLGDSYAEGAGVSRTNRFTSVLERLYRDSGDPSLEVYNAGYCGFDTEDEAKILRAAGDQVSPDVVVVVYVPNDAEGPLGPSVASFPLQNLFLEKLGSYAYYRLKVWRTLFDPDELFHSVVEQHKEGSAGWRLVTDSLGEISAWAEERSVPVYLVALPFFLESGERYSDVLDAVVAAAHARGLEARNGTGDYNGRLAELAVSKWDAHPGPEAHVITARELQRFVGRPWAEGR